MVVAFDVLEWSRWKYALKFGLNINDKFHRIQGMRCLFMMVIRDTSPIYIIVFRLMTDLVRCLAEDLHHLHIHTFHRSTKKSLFQRSYCDISTSIQHANSRWIGKYRHHYWIEVEMATRRNISWFPFWSVAGVGWKDIGSSDWYATAECANSRNPIIRHGRWPTDVDWTQSKSRRPNSINGHSNSVRYSRNPSETVIKGQLNWFETQDGIEFAGACGDNCFSFFFYLCVCVSTILFSLRCGGWTNADGHSIPILPRTILCNWMALILAFFSYSWLPWVSDIKRGKATETIYNRDFRLDIAAGLRCNHKQGTSQCL